MPSELGQTRDPKELVPGEPEALDSVEFKLLIYASYLHQAGEGLKRIDTEEGWSGKAAERFRDAFRGEPARWLEAGDAFEEAAKAVNQHRSTLSWAQGQAQIAIELWDEGQALTAVAKADHAEAVATNKQEAAAMTSMGVPTTPGHVPFVDPGAAKRAAATDILLRAREQLDMVGHEAAATVEAARDKAPEKPNFFQQVGEFFNEMGRGAVEGAVDLAKFALMVQPTRLSTDPFGYIHDMGRLTLAMSHAVTHPLDVASASWDEFKNNPGRGIGQLLPGIVLTGGAGVAAKGAQKVSKIAGVRGGAGATGRIPDKAPSKIEGHTNHGRQQALSRDGHGVSDEAMNDAVANPLKAPEVQPGGTFLYVGKDAVVVLNSEGKVVTSWATNSGGWRNK